jgi:N4-(beta-N-acetylglucosaminyl)-L-asparaginase
VLSAGGRALDAVEAGARVPEADLKNHSVGRAGYPDRDGHVSLDASIMDGDGSCGAVAALEHIAHPISVARRVMEKNAARADCRRRRAAVRRRAGIPARGLLTPESEQAWHEWLKSAQYKPEGVEQRTARATRNQAWACPAAQHNHDTIGMLALDSHGNLAGACTTSGMAWKLYGRVGDSPIIGAGTVRRQ